MAGMLSEHLAAANELSEELKIKSEEMRTLDAQLEPVLKQMDSDLFELLMSRKKQTRKPTKKQKLAHAGLEGKLKTHETIVQDLCSGKSAKATEMYDKVDKIIEKLDKGMKQLESEIKEESEKHGLDYQQPQDSHNLIDRTPKQGRGRQVGRGRPQGRGFLQGPLRKSGRGRQRPMGLAPLTVDSASPFAGGIVPPSGHHVSPPDVPLDSAEPRYCLCNRVSYGEMVACDHNECSEEWFHFGCVGLKKKPDGKWYCPQCTEARALAKAT